MATTRIDTVLLTGKTHTTAGVGRDRLDLQLSSPAGKEIALIGVQAHPTAEQLFAGAWSACYTGALGLAAKARKVTLPADLSVDVEVDLGMAAEAYLLQARFDIRAPAWRRSSPRSSRTRRTRSARTRRRCTATSRSR